MNIVFLQAEEPLTKKFYLDKDENLQKQPYKNHYYFTSHSHVVRTLQDFHDKIVEAAAKGWCLLKGETNRALAHESRAKATDPDTATKWICLDIDGLPGISSIEQFLEELPEQFRNTSYIAQYSSSMGVTDTGLSAHVFFMLPNSVSPSSIKRWLTHINLSTSALRNSLSLTKTHNAIRWTLDTSVCQNDKLIYITPPELGPGVQDNFSGPRIKLVVKDSEFLSFDFEANTPSDKEVEHASVAIINKLRGDLGLKSKRRYSTRTVKGVEVLSVTDQPEITGIKEERDFVYLNLNGGDSWGYFHPADNVDFIYNFKGEPTYLTRELLPDYYADNKDKAKEKHQRKRAEQATEIHTGQLATMAFIDINTDGYYCVVKNEDDEIMECRYTSKRLHVKDFFKEHGLDMPDFLPSWRVEYNFSEDYELDIDNRRMNTFKPSSYMKLAKDKDNAQCPKTIKKVIYHAIGSDDDTYEAFINWLATIFQRRIKTGIAWVLHGTQGTGKGILFNRIISPLLGSSNVTRTTIHTMLDEPYNADLANTVCCLVDEAQMADIYKSRKLNNMLKEYITEPTLKITKKFAHAYDAPNFTNFIIASNEIDPVYIDTNDRRFSVGHRQPARLEISQGEVDAIASELSGFADFLMSYDVDVIAAQRPFESAAREMIQSLTRDTNEEVATRIMQGDLEFLLENIPDIELPGELIEKSKAALPTYKEVLKAIRGDLDRGVISRAALQTLFFYITGNSFPTPHKFSKFIAHKGMQIEQVWFNGANTRGVYLERPWKHDAALIEQLDAYLEDKPQLREVK